MISERYDHPFLQFFMPIDTETVDAACVIPGLFGLQLDQSYSAYVASLLWLDKTFLDPSGDNKDFASVVAGLDVENTVALQRHMDAAGTLESLWDGLRKGSSEYYVRFSEQATAMQTVLDAHIVQMKQRLAVAPTIAKVPEGVEAMIAAMQSEQFDNKAMQLMIDDLPQMQRTEFLAVVLRLLKSRRAIEGVCASKQGVPADTMKTDTLILLEKVLRTV